METEHVQEESSVQAVAKAPATGEKQLSKNQRKKAEKLKKFKEGKKEYRHQQREKRKAKKLLAKAQGIVPSSGPSRKALKKNKIQFENALCKVAVDCSFDELMSDSKITSCAAQLMRVYTANRRAKHPLPVYFTGLKADSRITDRLNAQQGSSNWDIIRSEKSFLDLFDRDKIVYLSSEAEDVLEKLEKDHCYVIGGLVDHNSHKGLTFDLARKENIKTAKLPLQEHIAMMGRCVLTINQCFEILVGIADGGTWKDVLMQVLPQRKMPKLKKPGEEGESSESATTEEQAKND